MVPGEQSALMRRPEAEQNLKCPRFMAWICAMWRSKVALHELLQPIYTKDELAGLSYHRRVQKIYAADIASQFKIVPDLADACSAWTAANKKRQAKLSVNETVTERLCIEYTKSRMEVGASFLLAREVLDLARLPVAEVSTVTVHDIVDVCFST